MKLSEQIPLETLLEMAPEDLAGPLLNYLPTQVQHGRVHLGSFGNVIHAQYQSEDARLAAMEAWSVLAREGFIAESDGGFHFITRRGKAALAEEVFASFRVATLLPKTLLHPKLLPNVWGAFVRGEYDSAVFEAFKEVEIAVREAGGFPDSLLGTDLMRKAFDVKEGPLAEPEQHASERQALSDLFAGAIGSYKNPYSHRRVRIEPKESVEMIILASHLLSIVDSRARNG